MQASNRHHFDAAKQAANDEDNAAHLLLLEQEIREQTELESLLLHCVNSSRPLVQYNQCFAFQFRDDHKTPLKLRAISSQALFDKESPFVRWISRVGNTMAESSNVREQQYFKLPAYCDSEDPELESYPFKQFLWTPMICHGRLIGGTLAASEQLFQQSQRDNAHHLANSYAHAWQMFNRAKRPDRGSLKPRWRRLLPLMLLLGLAAVPYPITAIAPVEVSASQPFVISAPFDAVVKQITVAQGAVVEKGTPLLQLDDVEQRNELQIAREQVAVADARYQRASRSAIQSEEGRKELAVALAELQLARAEAAFAEEQLRQTGVIAQRDGIAVYTDKRDWEGRPVRAGEAILQIADPEQIEFSIDLPVSDSIVLRDGARIKVYLDSDPLRAIDAEIIATSYQPRLDKRQILSFRLRAQLPTSHDEPLPRIGTQGNARIFGDTAPLIYVLLRRPLTALRQTLGV
jgi:hypothetical protein